MSRLEAYRDSFHNAHLAGIGSSGGGETVFEIRIAAAQQCQATAFRNELR